MRLARRLLALVALPLLAASALFLAAPAGAKTVWLCKPGLKHDPCSPGLATTRYAPGGAALGVTHPHRARPRRADCFYVYPTVSDQPGLVADRSIDAVLRSIALWQAARYSGECRVFAPVYRQITLRGIGSEAGSVTPAMQQQGFDDVRAAWRTYLRRYNHGRPVVLIGHSQGTFVLRKLVAQEIDGRRAVRRRLLSAILLGGNVTVKRGSDRGGDFRHIRACRSSRQVGCVVAFSTYDAPLPPVTIFGRTGDPALQVLCTNPAALGGGTATVTPVIPSTPFAPGSIAVAISLLGAPQFGAGTPWIAEPRAYTARCSDADGASVLQVSANDGWPTYTASPSPAWGLHLVDANVALGNLVDLVRHQIRTWRTAHA